MHASSRFALLFLMGTLVISVGLPIHRLPDDLETGAEGEVRDEHGPVAGARVRFKGDAHLVLTDAGGRFRLRRPAASARITAWKEGYLIGGVSAAEPALRILLTPLPAVDNEDYAWIDPAPEAAERHNCGNCHQQIYNEWSVSGHARAATNRRFRNLYDGTDWRGRAGVGWSLLAEHPDGAGVCTACHAPTVPFSDPAYFDLRLAHGTAARGVHCDYCHKVAEVSNQQIGLTHGRFGLKLLRPTEGQLFFGPLDDVDRGEDAYSPVQRESRYCASCHEGTVFGVHVYSTFSEWLDSPARKEGKQCQTCHMAPTGTLTNLAPGRGGIERDPWTLASHPFPGGSPEMLRNCLKLTVRVAAEAKAVRTETELVAAGVGHRVPTGFVDRHLLLIVEAFRAGQRLPPNSGPALSALAGRELAGTAGRLHAKQLTDFDGRSPAPFWRAQPTLTDTRLRPGQPERSVFRFPADADQVRVRLVYRRFWQEVADTKGWPNDEITLIDRWLPVTPERMTNVQ